MTLEAHRHRPAWTLSRLRWRGRQFRRSESRRRYRAVERRAGKPNGVARERAFERCDASTMRGVEHGEGVGPTRNPGSFSRTREWQRERERPLARVPSTRRRRGSADRALLVEKRAARGRCPSGARWGSLLDANVTARSPPSSAGAGTMKPVPSSGCRTCSLRNANVTVKLDSNGDS